MTDLFLEPKVLDFQNDKYELILLTLRWARLLKAKGSPQPMSELVEKALRDLVDQRVTKEEILVKKAASPEPQEETPSVVSVAAPEGGAEKEVVAKVDLAEEAGKKSKTSKKKKK